MMFASVTASGVSGVAKGTSDVAAAAASSAAQAGVQNGHAGAGDASAYFVDTMLRSTNSADGDKADPRAEASQPEAQQRVDNVVNQLNDAEQKVRQAADVARKRAARLSIATALSMVIGAFIASAAAALGGMIRDEY
jgi:hypothetical protein